jgi:ADP-heptose:LPS heptosyltransferase
MAGRQLAPAAGNPDDERLAVARRVALPPGLMQPARVPGVGRLAVLRANGIGDYVTCEPALAALREAYPEAEITLLGAAHHRPLVEGRPGPCDRFVEVPRMPGVRAGSDPDAPDEVVAAFFAAQQAYEYDLAVQLHGGGRYSNPVVRRLGARVTAGAATPDARRLDREVPYTANTHEILRWLDVAAACGAPAVRRHPVLAVTAADRREADAVLRELQPGPAGSRLDAPIVALHPGATDPRRRWPVERLMAVARALPDATVAVLGSPGERPLVDAAMSAARRLGVPALDLGGRLSLGGMLGLLARSVLFLGNDSGPRHLAEALGVSTVAVFTNANLADVAPLSRVWHRIAVSWQSRCALCGTPVQETCDHGVTALADVEVDEVRALALELWSQCWVGQTAGEATSDANAAGDPSLDQLSA